MKSTCRWAVLATAWASFALALTANAANAPQLRIAVEGPALRLDWTAPADGAGVTIETASSLTAPSWTPAPNPSGWPTTALSWSLPLPTTGAAAFFRLVTAPAFARGAILTNVLLRSFTVAEMSQLFVEYSLPVGTPFAVEARRLVYATVDPFGNPTHASMLAALPVGATKALPFTAYLHGTITQREDVPSRLAGEADIGLLLAGSGYLSALPDYLGLGDSPGFHPYHHAKTHATASVDALRALRALVSDRTPGWNGQLFLTGYSQGGHAALATQRELETLHTNEFTLTASAPSAGAYDLSGTTTDDFLSSRLPPNPYYYAYFLVAYQNVYGLVANLSELLKAPYDQTLPALFDGRHSGGEINAAMPAHPYEILRPEVLEAFRSNPQHPLRAALRDNDLHTGWVPRTPTRLYHCQADLDVLPANSKVALNAFKAAGAPSVELVDPFFLADHGRCAPFALYGAKLWFDSLRK